MNERSGRPQLARIQPIASPQLRSWKEIAAYFGRDVRTVRRWEVSEGLPIHRLQHGRAGSVYAIKAELDEWLERHSSDSLVRRVEKLWYVRPVIVAALVFAVLLATTAGVVLVRNWPHQAGSQPVPLTGDPGVELEPSVSPAGTQVAYVWNGEDGDNYDIYVRAIGRGEAWRLTTNPAEDYSPAWSPDSNTIAFLRRTGAEGASVYLVPASGGLERKVADISSPPWPEWFRPGPFLAWSPDGNWLVTVGRQSGPVLGDVLLRISVASGEIRPLTWLPRNVMGDLSPAISPDGKKIAFSRRISWGHAEIYLLPVSEDLVPVGEPRRLVTGSPWNASPTWTPNGRSMWFSGGTMDTPHLARIATSGSGKPEQLTAAGQYSWQPSIARLSSGRNRVVYTRHYECVNIWRTSLDGSGPPVRLIASTHWSYEPSWSWDGKRIAFLSDRTGYVEIWVADADGGSPRQWTFLKRAGLGSPRWSPDGSRIAFTAPGAHGSSIYLIGAPGASAQQVLGSDYCGYLEWSPDGKAIYFSSNRGGHTDIWKITTREGKAERVTMQGARVPAISADARWLYYMRLASPAGDNNLWRVPLRGGDEEKVLEFIDAYSLADTAVAFKYYRPGPQPSGPYLHTLDLTSRQTHRLRATPRPLRYGIAISRDGRYLLHSQADFEVSNLMVYEEML